MFGLRLILILAVVGGLIAFIGDKLGSKIGKKKLSVFWLAALSYFGADDCYNRNIDRLHYFGNDGDCF